MTWTKQHDIELVKAYLGYEVNTPAGAGVVYCVDGNGKTHQVPDMRAGGHRWLLDCLDSWLRVRKKYRRARLELNYASLLDCETTMLCWTGEGDNMHEALAWALWRAR